MKNTYLNGEKYTGKATYVNGYNGYSKTKSDGTLCAIINNSAFTDSIPNALKDEKENSIHNEEKRGQIITIES